MTVMVTPTGDESTFALATTGGECEHPSHRGVLQAAANASKAASNPAGRINLTDCVTTKCSRPHVDGLNQLQDQAKLAGIKWLQEYGDPINIQGRTQSVIRRDGRLKPYLQARRHLEKYATRNLAEHCYTLYNGYKFYSYVGARAARRGRRRDATWGGRPFLSLTGEAYPHNGSAAKKLAWYDAELMHGVEAKQVHMGGSAERGSFLNNFSSQWLSDTEGTELCCGQCGGVVSLGARIEPRASVAEWRALRMLERDGLIDQLVPKRVSRAEFEGFGSPVRVVLARD